VKKCKFADLLVFAKEIQDNRTLPAIIYKKCRKKFVSGMQKLHKEIEL